MNVYEFGYVSSLDHLRQSWVKETFHEDRFNYEYEWTVDTYDEILEVLAILLECNVLHILPSMKWFDLSYLETNEICNSLKVNNLLVIAEYEYFALTYMFLCLI